MDSPLDRSNDTLCREIRFEIDRTLPTHAGVRGGISLLG